MSLASNVSWKPPAFVPIFGQNASILPKLHYIMGYKSIRYPFFRFFTKKTMLSCTYFVKKRPLSKKHDALMPIFCQKTSILSKTLCFHVIFLICFMKNPLLPCPYFVQKTSILSKQHWMDNGPKKSIRYLFFPIFQKHCSYVYILSI